MKRHIPLTLATIFTIAMSVCALQVQTANPPMPAFSGKVVAIADGDTLTVLCEKQQHRIRLEGIDGPESTQAFGMKARQVLGDKVFGKEVEVRWKSRDKYQRILGHFYLGKRHINLELLQEGFAWHYTRFNTDPAFAAAQKKAKEGKVGLWADIEPIAPWDFRHGAGSNKTLAAVTSPQLAKSGLNGGGDADATVYLTASGTKYHRLGCRYLSKSSRAIALADAFPRYAPCAVCNPPVMRAK